MPTKNFFKVTTILIVLMFALSSDANTPKLNNEAQINALVQSYVNNWNKHDMKTLSQLFTTDADFITVKGIWLKGRDDFFSAHEKMHQTVFKNSTFTAKSITITFITANIGLVHWYWELQGAENSDGTKKPLYKGIFTWLVIKNGNHWLVRASQNTIISDN